jgi:long-chain acyl-CoA synthetase
MSDDVVLKTLNEVLYENEKKWADIVYLRQPINDVWHTITWKETLMRARKIATFLKSLGLQKGDRVAILSKNCAEWLIADFAISLGGFISIPLYATQHREMIHYVLEHAEVKAIFVGKLDNWKEQEDGISKDIVRIAFPYENPMPAQYQWNELLATYEPQIENFIPDLDDLYTIIYTSGTTGNPKGVMISYRGLAYVDYYTKAENFYSKEEHNYFFSYLPLGHVYERIAVELASITHPSTVSFAESLEKFGRNLADTSPTIFAAVPRIWAQFQKKILEKIPEHKLNILLRIPLVSYLLKKKIKKTLGFKRAAFIASGSAPLSPHIFDWYKKLGIVITQGYGRTEDLTIATVCRPGKEKSETVGQARPGVEIKISEEGEILTRSKMVMTGYYKDIETTRKIFTEDGFMHTGDRGHLDEDGDLVILGRMNDSFKTDKGEFVNPNAIESKFQKNVLIEQLCLVGQNLPQPKLLIVLSEVAVVMDKEKIIKNLKGTLEHVNRDLAKYEMVSQIIIVKDHWTPENQMLTPTLKLKRHVIHDRYLELAQKNVDNHEVIIFE